MARLSNITTSDGIRVITRTDPNGREIIDSFHIMAFQGLLGLLLEQIRVLSEESREIVVDKLYAGITRPPGVKRVDKPPRLRRTDIPTVERRPFRHRALADSTLRKKEAAEQDGRRLIASGEYTYGIEVFKGMRGGKPYYIVRPKPGMHPDAGVPHRVLAAFHEFGTSRTPKRPHWGPTLRILKRILARSEPKVRAVAFRTAIRQVR